MFDEIKRKGFQVRTLHHAEAILTHDMEGAVKELEGVLLEVSLPVEELVRGGGGEGLLTQRIRKALNQLGWKKHSFEIKKIIDGKERESVSHEVDHVKDFGGWTCALELEWNNKDPFFDRDLDNFKCLHTDGVISIGAMITRGSSLQESLREIIERFALKEGVDSLERLERFYTPTQRQREKILHAVNLSGSFARGWARAFVADKFGEATTHWRKLEDRVDRGVGNPCPLLLIGLPDAVIVE